jgi:hypothetical protein
MADATDLKLQFLRFLGLSKSIKSNRLYQARSQEQTNSSRPPKDEQKRTHSCTKSCTQMTYASATKLATIQIVVDLLGNGKSGVRND